jgi:hypothetical protein
LPTNKQSYAKDLGSRPRMWMRGGRTTARQTPESGASYIRGAPKGQRTLIQKVLKVLEDSFRQVLPRNKEREKRPSTQEVAEANAFALLAGLDS